MRLRPGGRAMRFSAVEELAVDRIAFSWRARFPLAIRVFDGYSGGRGKLEARVLGVPVMRQSGVGGPRTVLTVRQQSAAD